MSHRQWRSHRPIIKCEWMHLWWMSKAYMNVFDVWINFVCRQHRHAFGVVTFGAKRDTETDVFLCAKISKARWNKTQLRTVTISPELVSEQIVFVDRHAHFVRWRTIDDCFVHLVSIGTDVVTSVVRLWHNAAGRKWLIARAAKLFRQLFGVCTRKLVERTFNCRDNEIEREEAR